MITVVVPVLNEAENIESLIAEIMAASARAPITEIVYVDDASTDATLDILKNLKSRYPLLRALRHDKRAGQSGALRTGIRAAKNPVIVTLDGDGQNNPADIALLFNASGFSTDHLPPLMVAGQRAKRNDNAVRRYTSRLANTIRQACLKDGTRDTGCSLKLFRRDDYLALPYFNHMHRYLPALMMREHVKIVHVDVSHRARAHGVSKYGTIDRLLAAVTDLSGVMWLQTRGCVKLDVKSL